MTTETDARRRQPDAAKPSPHAGFLRREAPQPSPIGGWLGRARAEAKWWYHAFAAAIESRADLIVPFSARVREFSARPASGAKPAALVADVGRVGVVVTRFAVGSA